MNPSWTAVILAVGSSASMHSSLPKVAHPIAGRSILRHVVEAALTAGVRDIVVVVGPDETDAVRKAAGADVRFVLQAEELGTADAVQCARVAAEAAEYVLILKGDSPLLLPGTLRRLMEAVDDSSTDLALLTSEVPVESYGYLEVHGDRVMRVIETKEIYGIDRSEQRLVNAGDYAVRASWLWAHLEGIAPALNGERNLSDLASLAYDSGKPAIAVLADEGTEVRGVNDRIQLAETEASMRERICRMHMLSGVTIVDPQSTFIDSGVTIGIDTRIEPLTQLHGVTRVGANCVVGPGIVVVDADIDDGRTLRASLLGGTAKLITLTILLTDIADSTLLNERIGDAAFHAKALMLDGAMRAAVRDHGGDVIDAKTLGDGILSTFSAASHAISAALQCSAAGDALGLPLHIGLHAGDVIQDAGNVSGGAVNIAARIGSLSAPSEILVSATVRDLARTSAGVTFEDRGNQALKGIAEPQHVFRIRAQSIKPGDMDSSRAAVNTTP